MNERTMNKQATATLNFPKTNTGFIRTAQCVGSGMQGNPYFPDSAEQVTKLNANVKVLDDLERECAINSLPKVTQARDDAKLIVKNDLRDLRLDVQKVANKNPLIAETIIKSAGMSVKMTTLRGKQQNTAEDGIEEGSVNLTAEGAGAHEWRYSLDGKEWMLLPSSFTSKTTVKGLTPGVLYLFQNRRMLTNDEVTEWSQSIQHRVR